VSVAGAKLVISRIDLHVLAEEKVASPSLDEAGPRERGTGVMVLILVHLIWVVQTRVLIEERFGSITAMRM